MAHTTGTDSIVRMRADCVQVGAMVDLEGDKYADPKRDHPGLACEYQTVVSVEIETDSCVAIGFEGFDVVGFPRDHLLGVVHVRRDAIRESDSNG